MFKFKNGKKKKKTWLDELMSANPNESSKTANDVNQRISVDSRKSTAASPENISGKHLEESRIANGRKFASEDANFPKTEPGPNSTNQHGVGNIAPFGEEVPPLWEEISLEELGLLPEDPAIQTTDKPYRRYVPQDTASKRGKGVFEGLSYQPRVYGKDVKLTFILIENSAEVLKEKDKLEQIVASLVRTGYVYVINYGSDVRTSELLEAKSLDYSKLLYQEDMGDKACLFDALIALERMVKESYKGIDELKEKHENVDSIDIIGIGRCIDNGSIVSDKVGIEIFSNMSKRHNLMTKYFCLSEENFINAATIGFRSIGSFARNYM